MAEPEHQRVAAGIDQLVDPAGCEPAGNVDMAVGRDDRLNGTLIVETGAALDSGKAPAFRRHGYPLVIRIAPPRQAGFTGIEGYRWMAAHGGAATQRECRDPRAIGDVLGS